MSLKVSLLNGSAHQGHFSIGMGEGFTLGSFPKARVRFRAVLSSRSFSVPKRFGVAAFPTQSPIENRCGPYFCGLGPPHELQRAEERGRAIELVEREEPQRVPHEHGHARRRQPRVLQAAEHQRERREPEVCSVLPPPVGKKMRSTISRSACVGLDLGGDVHQEERELKGRHVGTSFFSSSSFRFRCQAAGRHRCVRRAKRVERGRIALQEANARVDSDRRRGPQLRGAWRRYPCACRCRASSPPARSATRGTW